MSHRHQEHIEAARAEAIRLGAEFEVEQRQRSFVAVIRLNGRQRKIAFSISPSRLAAKKCVADVRRSIRELTA